MENVFPQAVKQSTDTLPDIYKPAAFKDGWVHLAADLKVGDRVRLIDKSNRGHARGARSRRRQVPHRLQDRTATACSSTAAR